MKRLTVILGIFILLLVSLSNAQQTWERTYGGSDYDGGMSVQQTTDRGYIVAGSTFSFGNECQVYLVKTNASGDTLWTKNYGELMPEGGMSVQQTSDSGYIILGDRVNDFYLIKTNTTGDTLWTRPYGWQNWAEGRSVRQTADGGYIIVGSTYLDGQYSDQFFVVKTNASGDTLWTRSYGGSDFDRGHSVQQTFDGGYIAAGMVWSFGNQQQVYLIRFDAFGDTLWTKTYGGPYWEWGHSVQQISDTGYIIAAGTTSFGDTEQVYLIKTNASGDTLWTRTYGGARYDEGWSVQQTTDGGYIVAGETNSFGNGYQVYLIKTDANGNVGVETPVRQLDGSTVRKLKATPNPFTTFATLPGHEAERFSLNDVSGRKVGVFRGDRIGEGPGV